MQNHCNVFPDQPESLSHTKDAHLLSCILCLLHQTSDHRQKTLRAETQPNVWLFVVNGVQGKQMLLLKCHKVTE